MTAALGLLAYALALAVLAPRLLVGARWVERAPRVAIALWQAITASVVVSVVLGAVALTFPTTPISVNLAELLQECFLALRDRYASPGGAAATGVGVVLALGVIGRVAWCAVVALVQAGVTRRRIRNVLAVVGRKDHGRQIVVVDHGTPAAYCVPGTRRRIVVTTAALDALDDAELTAVLAHERAHLRGRHDLLIAGAAALARGFGRVRLFRLAHEEITRLVELLADDVAVRSGADRLTVAGALLTLGGTGGGGPVGALAAGGSAAGARVRRLIAGRPPLGRVHTGLGGAAVAGLLAIPMLVLAVPAALAFGSHYCPPNHVTMMQTSNCPDRDCAFHTR